MSLTTGRVAPEQYSKWLAQGRRQHQRKDFKGAVAAFKNAHSARPTDTTALAELGWSAYLARDLAVAEAATRAALKAAGTDEKSLRGAALYNLGMILEASNEKASAISAYADSFVTRPSTAAKNRLTTLDPAAAEAALAFRGHALDGPTASLLALCKDEQVTLCAVPDAPGDFEPISGVSSLSARAPDLDVRVSSIYSGPYANHLLAIRTAAGWYVNGMFFTNMAVTGGWTSAVEIDSLTYQDVIVGPPSEVVLKHKLSSASGGSSADRGESSSEERGIVLCGIDKAGRRTCTDPIILEASSQSGDGEAASYSLRVNFVPPDWVELTHDQGKLPDSIRALLGRHRFLPGQ